MPISASPLVPSTPNRSGGSPLPMSTALPAVHLAISLIVAVEIHAANLDTALHRVLPDAGGDDLTVPAHLSDRADVHGDHTFRSGALDESWHQRTCR